MCVAAAAGHCGLVYRVKTASYNSSSGAKAMTHTYVHMYIHTYVQIDIHTHVGVYVCVSSLILEYVCRTGLHLVK